jgi:prevent-host-death family protein
VRAIRWRELRDDVSEMLRRAEAGERIIVTVDGRAVAELGPVTGSRPPVKLGTLRALAPPDDDWLADQQRLRDADAAVAVDPWACPSSPARACSSRRPPARATSPW